MDDGTLRDQEVELIQSASEDEGSSQFEILMTTFELGQEYRQALSTALATVDWRRSSRPLRAIHRAVLAAAFGTKAKKTRKGVSLGLSPAQIGIMAHHADTLETIRGKDGTWRQGGGLNPEWTDEPRHYQKDDAELFFGRGSLIRMVRPKFLRTIDPDRHLCAEDRERIVDPYEIIDWHAALRKAGLDDFEEAVFHSCMGRDRGQSKTLADYSEEGYSRNEIAAAIKRVRRKLAAIRSILFCD